MDKSGHMDWREEALQAEMKRLKLGPAQQGETLTEYMARYGVSFANVIKRIPAEKRYATETPDEREARIAAVRAAVDPGLIARGEMTGRIPGSDDE